MSVRTFFALSVGTAAVATLCRLMNHKPQEATQGNKDKTMRDNLSERQVDQMGEDSFPASDPAPAPIEEGDSS